MEAVEEFKTLYAHKGRRWKVVETMFEKFIDVSRQLKGRPTLVSAVSVTQHDKFMIKVILVSMSGKCLYQGDCAASDKLRSITIMKVSWR